jgi:hypothetical protein
MPGWAALKVTAERQAEELMHGALDVAKNWLNRASNCSTSFPEGLAMSAPISYMRRSCSEATCGE